ncbi:MAG TPA: dihydrolipoyl dehydrogenase [Gillisia sp.]|nr:dihydrolipoyl dehydrogenase [Gillisia sp.]
MPEDKKKELIVIGAGPGGYAAAFRAADLGLKVSLIDPEANPGGVCLYRGCIPSKALLQLVKIKQDAAKAAGRGMKFQEPEIDLKKIGEWKDGVVKKLTQGLGELSKARNVEYIRGKAKFKSPNEVEVTAEEGDTYTLQFENAIIATGSRPLSLPDMEFDGKQIISSSEALELIDIPDKMLIVGGGYIGLELGSVYAAFGSKVSMAEMTPGFLPGADRDLVEVFEKENPDLFEEVWFETEVTKASKKKDKVKVILKTKEGEKEKEFDKIMIAIGREPETEFLGLENAEVETDDKGFIKVDAKRQTSSSNIYAIGDLTGEPMLAHKATHEGRVSAEVLAGEKGAAYDARSVPGIVFTNPEIAWCGLTETEAEEKGTDIRILKFPWSASGRAVSLGAENGFTKLIVHPETGILLGGGVAGKNAGILIPEISLAIEMGASAEDIALSIHPHPTLSETIMEAAELFSSSPTHIFKK